MLKLQLAAGISKFKCATIAEAEMAAKAGAPEVLLAYQPVGPRGRRYASLVDEFREHTRFSCIVDDAGVIEDLSEQAIKHGAVYTLFLDVDCGQGRTGIMPGQQAVELYRMVSSKPGLQAGGLHAYDGNIHDSDVEMRRKKCNEAIERMEALRGAILDAGMTVPVVVAGGTPTFPFHAGRSGVECGPGTNVLWDAGYMTSFKDLDFLPAALVLTRVASKPRTGRICLDLGHKAIASEGPHPRVIFPDLPDGRVLMHNEEHLVIETEKANNYNVGDVLYGIPWHVCPTVNLYNEAIVVLNGRAGERWNIAGRNRRNEI